MNSSLRLVSLGVALLLPLIGSAQDASDVETKAYGSYAGGKFDTVDLSTGNLFFNIPLLSYPQRGKLPPLTFSVELNNAPYTRSTVCFPDDVIDGTEYDICNIAFSRYDTSAPGASSAYDVLYLAPSSPGVGISGKVGAYITSSYEGPIVNGSTPWTPCFGQQIPVCGVQLLYSLTDASGKTHALESDADNLNIYHAQDGSGWTFLPAGPGNAYDYFDPENDGGGNWPTGPSAQYWLPKAGVRRGTILSPGGIQYNYQFLPEPTLTENYVAGTGQPYSVLSSLLSSTATDPLGNSVTRGPWYWGAASSSVSDIRTFYSNPSNQPVYVDSVGRTIPDIVSLQETAQGAGGASSGTCPAGTTGLAWNPPGAGGSTLSYTFCYTYMALTLAFGAYTDHNPAATTPETAAMNVLTSIVLPSGTKWTFTYDPQTTNLLKVGLPTGGNISYTYQVADARCMLAPCEAVMSRTENDGLGHSSTKSYTFNDFNDINALPYYTTTETDSMQNDTVHTFSGVYGGILTPHLFETKTVYYHGSSLAKPGIVLKSIATDHSYQWDSALGASGVRAINVLPIKITTTTPAGTTVVGRKYSSDMGTPLFNGRSILCLSSSTVNGGDNPSSCADYRTTAWMPANSYGVKTNSPAISYVEPDSETVSWIGMLLRTTTTHFQFETDGRYKAANLISLPQSVQAADVGVYSPLLPASTITTYFYDESNHGPAGVFGNLTSTNTVSYMAGMGEGQSTFSTSTGATYNSNGMPTGHTDGNGNTTAINYDPTGLFVSSIQRPTTNGVPHIDYYSYDSTLGYLNWHTDENGSAPADVNHTTVYTHDLLGRVTAIQYPGGGGSAFCYTDTGGPACSRSEPPFQLFTSTVATPDPAVLTMHTYDGLGRSIQSSLLSDPLGADLVDTAYDSEGRVQSVSNPYRAPASLGDPAVGRTSYTYDALGRKTLQTQPDGSRQQWCYDGIATNGQTNCSRKMARTESITVVDWIDFSDETGKHIQHMTNALGQLASVMEPSPGTGALSLETDYYHDGFGDLLAVNQLGADGSAPRTRWFSYYAPSLLRSACNPETLAPGQTCEGFHFTGLSYSYDPNGNVRQKTDNRGLSVNYKYDELNRLTGKWSSDQATPSSCYQYDTLGAAKSGIGRLAAAWTQSASAGACSPSVPFWSKRSILSYDAMGGILGDQQCTPSNCASGTSYSSSYSYNLAGKLRTYTNGINSTPSVGSLQFTNAYDAAGRLQTLSSNWNDGTHPGMVFSAQAGPFTSCSNSTISYSPSGGLINATFGNGLTLNRSYDNRSRTVCEVDSGYGSNQPATSGFGVVQLTGQEQVK